MEIKGEADNKTQAVFASRQQKKTIFTQNDPNACFCVGPRTHHTSRKTVCIIDKTRKKKRLLLTAK